jgi:hypothetical protein
MPDLCSNQWGAPWGSYWPPCDPVDPVATALGRARQRMLEDPFFRSLVQLLGEMMAEVEVDAWALYHRVSPTVATGALLAEWGASYSFPKPSLLWDSTKYREVMGAWVAARMHKSVPNLLRLIDSLEDGETIAITEGVQTLVIDVQGIDDDTATIWAQVLEAARPKTVGYWLTYSDGGLVWIIGVSLLGVDTVLGGSLVLGP